MIGPSDDKREFVVEDNVVPFLEALLPLCPQLKSVCSWIGGTENMDAKMRRVQMIWFWHVEI
jgi:hypothetical protein